MKKKDTGIFGAMEDVDVSIQYDHLESVSEDNPDTIFKLLFEEYDKEKDK